MVNQVVKKKFRMKYFENYTVYGVLKKGAKHCIQLVKKIILSNTFQFFRISIKHLNYGI